MALSAQANAILPRESSIRRPVHSLPDDTYSRLAVSVQGRCYGVRPDRCKMRFDLGNGMGDVLAVFDPRRPSPVSQQGPADALRRPGNKHPDTSSSRFLGSLADCICRRRIQKWHRGKVDDESLVPVDDAIEDRKLVHPFASGEFAGFKP